MINNQNEMTIKDAIFLFLRNQTLDDSLSFQKRAIALELQLILIRFDDLEVEELSKNNFQLLQYSINETTNNSYIEKECEDTLKNLTEYLDELLAQDEDETNREQK